MAKGKTVCNVCGKAFDTFDDQEHIGFHQTIGYGSNHYDGCTFDLDICCKNYMGFFVGRVNEKVSTGM